VSGFATKFDPGLLALVNSSVTISKIHEVEKSLWWNAMHDSNDE
jgi:hypothetical protein